MLRARLVELDCLAMRRLACLVVFIASLSRLAAADPIASRRQTSVDDQRAIEKVVRDFQLALKSKNTRLLSSLMLSSSILFVSPFPPDRTEEARATVDVNFTGLPPGGFYGFAEFIKGSKVPIEERFYNVSITQDAHLAVVTFDFEFVEGGSVRNHGLEVWQLLKTDRGWKIMSVVWTSKGPPKR
jgi:hypothetical protein